MSTKINATQQPMYKRMSNSTMCKQMIAMVYSGASMLDLIKASGRCESTIYRLFHEHYAKPGCAAHKKLLKQLRENTAKMREAQNLSLVPQKPDFVIVTETGALMKHLKEIKDEGAEVFIPKFCINELIKLGVNNTDAILALQEIRSHEEIFHTIYLPNEVLMVDPPVETKPRIIGVVATVCEMWVNGFNVKLITTSRNINQVTFMQELGPNVEVVLKD